MKIRVEKEPDELPGIAGIAQHIQEPCCFCREPTRYWVAPVTGQSVACCLKCSRRYSTADLPTKAEWMRRHTQP